ncbi:hypothetical protein FBY05_101473 [Pseudomonas sp. SJZ083]|jgi:hypothetical protein|uniref:Uncharacterized protein n=1 Tax=Pseudomonas mandelii TaxID=75612 RepID=A0ABY0VV89_9PSED|nr:hypothetical protein [Pseudomonas silensiensis]TWC27610.1 hypothetical protein FBY05_101473 [Pseudomonas sp. SJZ083]TWC54050.1 hypothetical protein FBY01_101243 [Pseudomonas sp. SJZ077]SDU57568.1 hypothetical protein SAMN04489801_4611 [Pseudomonas mandelii]
MKKLHGSLQKRELKFIVECNIYLGKGMRLGIFHFSSASTAWGRDGFAAIRSRLFR